MLLSIISESKVVYKKKNENENEKLQMEDENVNKYNKISRHNNDELFETNWAKQLKEQLLDQKLQHQMVEKDHQMMEKWLVDNINDLHRELKQTELDFEHYVQVTKRMLVKNERQIRQQVDNSIATLLKSMGGDINNLF